MENNNDKIYKETDEICRSLASLFSAGYTSTALMNALAYTVAFIVANNAKNSKKSLNEFNECAENYIMALKKKIQKNKQQKKSMEGVNA